MKKIVSFLVIVTLLFPHGINVLADEIPTPPANQISSNPTFASDEKYFPVNPIQNSPMGDGGDGLNLMLIQSTITKESSTSVTVTATTTANLVCIDIGAAVEIQRWHNNAWEHFYTLSFWDAGLSSTSITETISVATGFYYRVHTLHMASTWISSRTGYTTTKSILIN